MRGAVVSSLFAGILLSFASACGDSQPPPKNPKQDDGVPANSLSDARLHGDAPKDDNSSPSPEDSKADPTQPYTTKVGEAPPPEPSKPNAKPAGNGKGAVTRAECDRAMDKYLELEIAQNPQLKNVSPEVIEQVKQMAREKHGEAPCTATRAQYTCAIAATSTAAWQRCMK